MRSPGLPYLGDELEEGVGVEGANRQSYEVEQQPLVKGLLQEGHHAGPHEGAEGDDGHAEETISPHCRWGEPAPPRTGRRASAPWHGSHHLGEKRGRARGGVNKEGFGRYYRRQHKGKIRETSREGERNRKFVSDSSLMKFPLISSEEMKRNLRWSWNSVAPAPAALGGPSHTCQLV